MTCDTRLLKEGRRNDAALFNLHESGIALHNTCDFRCPGLPDVLCLSSEISSTAYA